MLAKCGTPALLYVTLVPFFAFSELGAVQCGGAVTLNSFLSTTDGLTDPRVQFDNVNQRFSLTVTVSGVITASSTPAMWLATSLSEDPCGSWFLYRMTF